MTTGTMLVAESAWRFGVFAFASAIAWHWGSQRRRRGYVQGGIEHRRREQLAHSPLREIHVARPDCWFQWDSIQFFGHCRIVTDDSHHLINGMKQVVHVPHFQLIRIESGCHRCNTPTSILEMSKIVSYESHSYTSLNSTLFELDVEKLNCE